MPEGTQLPELHNEDEMEGEHEAREYGHEVDGEDRENAEEPASEPEEDEDYDDSNPPLLFVDVNLGQDEQQRIVVYEGDTAEDLAEKFCAEH